MLVGYTTIGIMWASRYKRALKYDYSGDMYDTTITNEREQNEVKDMNQSKGNNLNREFTR